MNGIHTIHGKVEAYFFGPRKHDGTKDAHCAACPNCAPSTSKKAHLSPRPLRLGFIALSDCAPLVMAQELGLYARFGLKVELHREVGWATIRDKVIYGELDAAHAPAGLVVAASCGLGSVQVECLTGLVLNLHGNAITLSQELWNKGVRDGRTLRQEITRRHEPCTFGVVHAYSAHHFLLRELAARTANRARPRRRPDRHRSARAGLRQSQSRPSGWFLCGRTLELAWRCSQKLAGAWPRARTIAPRHPEKAIDVVRREFADALREHLPLIAALTEAQEFCARPENRELIIETLAQPESMSACRSRCCYEHGGHLRLTGTGALKKQRLVSSFRLRRRQRTDARQSRMGHPPPAGQWPRARSWNSCRGKRMKDWFRADLFQQAARLRGTNQP